MTMDTVPPKGIRSPVIRTLHDATTTTDTVVTKDNVSEVLARDIKVKVAGVDCDGILRGKIMAKDKFLASIESGFAMSSAIFGWDMHDTMYTTETNITSAQEGYSDFLAVPDLASFRRLPFENEIPFFLVDFVAHGQPVAACGRSLLRSLVSSLEKSDCRALAGVELEFMNFRTPSEDGYEDPNQGRDIAAYLAKNGPQRIRPLTSGMFGYSVTRPLAYKEYFHQVFDQAHAIKCGVESWHTESGPGVCEAALKVCAVEAMADKVTLFKLLTRSIGIENGITPCFMAKPMHGLPGNSGHVHISLVDKQGLNLFARDIKDPNPEWPDIARLSDLGRRFLAGILDGLEDVMPLLAPTVNSYKRLVENYWAPVDLSWGLEHRLSSIRLIAPPVCKPSATRFEIRVPGADLHPHYALAAIMALGWRGVQQGLEIKVPASASQPEGYKARLLPNTLEAAVARFKAPQSVAREILPGDFVDFFAATREHEIREWREAVTDWEFRRYIETV